MLKLIMKSLGLSSALVIAAMAAGCAPAPKGGTTTDRMDELKSVSLNAFSRDASGFSCPSSYNVKLKNNIGANGSFDYSGNGSFKVCVGQDASQFRITGLTTSSTICVYPMSASGNGGVQLVESPQCFAVTGSPISVSFASSSINYISIVDVGFTNQMNSCLSSASPCPSHSEGFVQ